MSIRENLDISSYLVVGPENTLGRPVKDIVRAAVEADFSLELFSMTLMSMLPTLFSLYWT